MRSSVTLVFSAIPLSVIFLSCNRYIDVSKENQISVQQGYFQFYRDSNVLVYKSNVALIRDTEKVYPKSFKVKLPKRIKHYEFVGSSDFAFYYGNNQVVFIKINLENGQLKQESFYVPSGEQLESFIQQVATDNNKKYDIKKIPSKAGRVSKIMVKGEATILLYNILENNEELFSNYLSSLTFFTE